MKKEHARKLRELIVRASLSLSDEDALEGVELFPMWTIKPYEVGDRIRYNDILYKCIQAHTSQSDWTPDVTPSLWTRVSIDEFPEWVQPLGSEDAYQTGDKVSHNGKHWVSTADNNVWEPGIYGWDEI